MVYAIKHNHLRYVSYLGVWDDFLEQTNVCAVSSCSKLIQYISKTYVDPNTSCCTRRVHSIGSPAFSNIVEWGLLPLGHKNPPTPPGGRYDAPPPSPTYRYNLHIYIYFASTSATYYQQSFLFYIFTSIKEKILDYRNKNINR